jgi:hypothetical protein
MQLKSTMTSQTIRFFADVEPTFDVRSPVPLIRGLQDQYGFMQVPLTVAELDFKAGVTFLRGYYRGRIIEKFQVYENGLLCEASEDTDLADDFLSEVLAWAIREHSLPVRETGVLAYISQLEVTSLIDLGSKFSSLNAVGSLLAQCLKEYGQPVSNYDVSGLRMHYDSMATPIPRPPHFVFERRVGQQYSTNEFFSSAPVRTKDHLKILDLLESALN